MPITLAELAEIQFAIRTRAEHGWRNGLVQSLADRYGLHPRTVYRYGSEIGAPVEVRIGHYSAWFAARVRGGLPVQLTEWSAAQEQAA